MQGETVKEEVFRLLNPRWHLYRIALLYETGFDSNEIGEALRYRPKTVENYYRRAKKELEHEGTLWFLLTQRTRTILMLNKVDPKEPDAPEKALGVLSKYKGMPGATLGPATCNEILDAIDEFYERQAHRKQLAGE